MVVGKLQHSQGYCVSTPSVKGVPLAQGHKIWAWDQGRLQNIRCNGNSAANGNDWLDQQVWTNRGKPLFWTLPMCIFPLKKTEITVIHYWPFYWRYFTVEPMITMKPAFKGKKKQKNRKVFYMLFPNLIKSCSLGKNTLFIKTYN